MEQKDKVRILHIIEAAEEAISFLGNINLEELNADRKLSLALIKELEIIGEASSRINDEVRTANPEIPWKEIIGMHNRLIHVYFDFDSETLWKTIKNDLPPLVNQFKHILKLQS